MIMTDIISTFITPSGEEMVVLSRKDYDALCEAHEFSLEDVLNSLIAFDDGFECKLALQFPQSALKQARKTKGYSQKQLADALNMSQAMISSLESGKLQGSLDTWKKIAKLLNVEINITC